MKAAAGHCDAADIAPLYLQVPFPALQHSHPVRCSTHNPLHPDWMDPLQHLHHGHCHLWLQKQPLDLQNPVHWAQC